MSYFRKIACALGFGAPPDETPPDPAPAPVRFCKDCRYVQFPYGWEPENALCLHPALQPAQEQSLVTGEVVARQGGRVFACHQREFKTADCGSEGKLFEPAPRPREDEETR